MLTAFPIRHGALLALAASLLWPVRVDAQAPDHTALRRHRTVNLPRSLQIQQPAHIDGAVAVADDSRRAATSQTTGNPPPPALHGPGIVDHHVHVLGPDVLRDWKSLGVPFSRPDPVYLSPAALLRDDLREMTLDRVLFGSDYPVLDPVRGRQALVQRVGLTVAEADRVVRGVGGGVFPARECQPPLPMDRLLALRTQRYVVSDSLRGPLALGLLSCLASRDPVLRDDVAASALSVWLRGKLLPASLVRELAGRTLGLLTAPRDTAGFAQSFGALVLSEIVRADRLDSTLTPLTLGAISEAAIAHMTAIRDYRGFDATEGWRHDVAHTADLILQLGMHPRVPTMTIERLLGALATQVGGHDGHLFLASEPERLARAVALIYGRGVLPAELWDGWLRGIADPGALGHWGNAFQTAGGMARRQNTLSFLYALGFAARVAAPTPHAALLALVDRELRRMIAV